MGINFMRNRIHRAPGTASKGFSLIELMAVMFVMTLLMLLTVPAIQSVIQSYQIKQAGVIVQSNLSEAKQHSFSLNRPVQIRICRAASPSNAPYQTIQIFFIDTNGRPTPITRPARLPQGVCIASDPKVASVMALPEVSATKDDPAIGEMKTQYSYRKFTIYPSGVTDLEPRKKWFLTVINERTNRTSAKLTNFASIQIDPVNGLSTAFTP